MKVLVAMSGGVDSSVAAALVQRAGHDATGVTLKLWGGRSDTGCCSAADVADARSVAHKLGIDHLVFNFAEEFGAAVVEPYVRAHAEGRTPNPCVECNRSIKFGLLLERAVRLGYDAVATGHHARVVAGGDRGPSLRRGVDGAKDQSYVLAMLTERALARLLLPVGEMTKAEVRRIAAGLGLRTAGKPDSQDVCFIPSRGDGAGRAAFLGERTALHQGEIFDADTGAVIGTVPAVELVTVGQRRGIGAGGSAARRYVLDVDAHGRRVVVGRAAALSTSELALGERTWVHAALGEGAPVLVQWSAHGRPVEGAVTGAGVRLDRPIRRVAPGQTVALYEGDEVVGSGIAA